MSTIGTGVAASVAAQAVSERQAVSKRTAEARETEKLRRELADRFSPSNASVEEANAAAAVEGDDESPADSRERERSSERQRNAGDSLAKGDLAVGHIDLQA